VQGDEPVLDPHVISLLVDALRLDPLAVVATPIAKIQHREDLFNPSIPKCIKDQNHYAIYFSRSPIPYFRSDADIDSMEFFRHIGIYAYRRHFLLNYSNLAPTPLQLAEDLEQLKIIENGYKIKVVEVNGYSIEVNHPEDIQKVESYLCEQNIFS
jgi:3-deoxy-manno-octulosonate cytidylyltransferase (CMP-KDO synthetase)